MPCIRYFYGLSLLVAVTSGAEEQQVAGTRQKIVREVLLHEQVNTHQQQQQSFHQRGRGRALRQTGSPSIFEGKSQVGAQEHLLSGVLTTVKKKTLAANRDEMLLTHIQHKEQMKTRQFEKNELISTVPVGQHRQLQAATQRATYIAEFRQISSGCSGWMPQAEVGCSGGGELDIFLVESLTDFDASCTEHPIKGPSYALCDFNDFPEDLVFDEGLVTVLDVVFLCEGTSESEVVGEATLPPQSDLECNGSSDDDTQANFATISYVNLSVDPPGVVQDFSCIQGDVLVLEAGNGCISRSSCSMGGCSVGPSSSRQRTPFPSKAGPVVPTTGMGTVGDVSAVTYRASFLQISDAGCSGFNSAMQLECSGGGSLNIIDTTSTSGFEPTCTIAGNSSLAQCAFDAIQGFIVSLDVGFTCNSDNATGLIGEARILADVLTCPSDNASVGNFVSVRHLDLLNIELEQDFSCQSGLIQTLDSGRSFCSAVANCTGGTCAHSTVDARQSFPVPKSAVLESTVGSASVSTPVPVPTGFPTLSVTEAPTRKPTLPPTRKPTLPPTRKPTSPPTLKPTPTPVPPPVPTEQQEWLRAHNRRRQAFHTANGVSYVPLQWSASLARSAQQYTQKLLDGFSSCHIQHRYLGDKYGGENLASRWSSQDTGPTPEATLTKWFEDEEFLRWPNNGHRTQVAWRATHYVGCVTTRRMYTKLP